MRRNLVRTKTCTSGRRRACRSTGSCLYRLQQVLFSSYVCTSNVLSSLLRRVRLIVVWQNTRVRTFWFRRKHDFFGTRPSMQHEPDWSNEQTAVLVLYCLYIYCHPRGYIYGAPRARRRIQIILVREGSSKTQAGDSSLVKMSRFFIYCCSQ